MGPGVRGVRLAISLLLALALCTVPFGESGCVFVDSEKTGQISFQAWQSECHNWTTQGDFLNCTRVNVDVNSQPNNVTLAMNGSGRPFEPTVEVGDGYEYEWSEPGTASYAGEGEHPPASPPTEVALVLENMTTAHDLVEDSGTGGEEPENFSVQVQATGVGASLIEAAERPATPSNLTIIGRNESAEEVPEQELGDQVFVGGDEADLAPAIPVARAESEVRGLWDEDWSYRAPVTITNPGEHQLIDYQVRVEVPYRTDMNLDFSDIRFTNDTGHLLPHWHDEHADIMFEPAVFWVRVPSIPAEGTTIYLHYGNWFAQSASNGTATFLFYDDFDDDPINSAPADWADYGKISVKVKKQGGLSSNRFLRVEGISEDNEGHLVANHSACPNIFIRERVKFGSSCRAGVTGRFVDTENYLSAPVIENESGYFAWISGKNEGNVWNSSEVWEFEKDFFQDEYVEELGLFDQRADLFIDGNYLGSAYLPSDAPTSGKTGLFVRGKDKQYRDEHIVRSYSPVYGESYYLSPGTLLSDVFDTGANDSKWDSLAWNAITSPETNVSFEVRASNANFSYNNATLPWTPVGNTSPVSTNLPSGRYLQWRANLSTDDETQTPVLQEVRVWYTPGGY